MNSGTRILRTLLQWVALIAALAFVAGPQAIRAQADLGSVRGTVSDVSGALIPNASVTVTNPATGAQRATTTNASGEYSVTQLPAGEYELRVSAKNFTNAAQKFTLTVGSSRGIDLKLAVAGGLTEVLVTSDNTTAPDSVDAQIATNITPSQVQNLPLPDRDPYSLVSLSGNVSSQITGGDRGVGVDIGGARSASVDILLDGAENTDLFGVGVGQSIPQDAMQEFSVVVAGQGAEFGRAVRRHCQRGHQERHQPVPRRRLRVQPYLDLRLRQLRQQRHVGGPGPQRPRQPEAALRA